MVQIRSTLSRSASPSREKAQCFDVKYEAWNSSRDGILSGLGLLFCVVFTDGIIYFPDLNYIIIRLQDPENIIPPPWTLHEIKFGTFSIGFYGGGGGLGHTGHTGLLKSPPAYSTHHPFKSHRNFCHPDVSDFSPACNGNEKNKHNRFNNRFPASRPNQSRILKCLNQTVQYWCFDLDWTLSCHKWLK